MALLCLFMVWSVASLRVAAGFGFRHPIASRVARVALATTTSLSLSSTSSTSSTTTATSTYCSNTMTTTTNPLLKDWSPQPFLLPPFKEVQASDYKPALEEGMKADLADLQAIIDNPDGPTFENVIQAYDTSGSLLSKVGGVYGNMCSSMNTEELQAVQTELSPILSRHRSKTYTLPGLFDKIDQVHQKRLEGSGDELSLTSEQIRLVERVHMDFVRSGAQLEKEAQAELADIKARLAELRTQFQQNVLKDESDYELVVTKEDLEGCPDSLVESSKQAATERNKPDDYVITLSRSLVEPFLVFCQNRELRKTAFEAWTKRGEMSPERDNIAIGQEMLKLRQQQAQLYGYKSYAEFQCVDRMAKTPENVMNLLENVWERAKVSADKEREALEAYLQEEGIELEGGIQPWDWRYVAEKVRKSKYDFDESLLKPYLSLDSVRSAMFAVSGNLFGLKYIPRPDLDTYHPDVDAYEVRNKDDKLVSIFLHDNFSRQHKSSGAWMSEYRSQTKNLVSGADPMEGIPIVSNNNNFAKASGATLLSHDGKYSTMKRSGERILLVEGRAHDFPNPLSRCHNHVSRVWACPSRNVIGCNIW
jgi:peptidyl-dipeptidase Dcp